MAICLIQNLALHCSDSPVAIYNARSIGCSLLTIIGIFGLFEFLHLIRERIKTGSKPFCG
jgi:hypothetical protein